MDEIKDNSITVSGKVLNSTEKQIDKGQVVELKVRIGADQLDGKRDAFAKVLDGTSIMTFTPNQTELDTDGEPIEAEGQTDLGVDNE